MAIEGIEQPEILQINDELRVNEIYEFNIASRKCL